MNTAPTANPAISIWILLFAFALLLLAPSNKSFWIDEGAMEYISGQPTPHTALLALRQVGSEKFMPLSVGYFWTVNKLVGSNEWALRCGNLPWLLIALYCMFLIGRTINWPWLPLLFAVHPFVWFYADELRPYSIQLAAGAWLSLGFLQLLQSGADSKIGRWNVALASLSVISASVLGIFVVLSLCFSLVTISSPTVHRILRLFCGATQRILFAVSIVAFLVFIIICQQQTAHDHKGWLVGFTNLGFAFYELLGFSGLGPPREELRSVASTRGLAEVYLLFIPHTKVLVLLCFLYITLFFTGSTFISTVAKYRVDMLALFSVFVLSILLLFFASLLANFPFWGRHLAAALPFLIISMGIWIKTVGRSRSTAVEFLLLGSFLTLFLYSSLELRFNPLYGKDNYRDAAGLARQAVSSGKLVCWSGYDLLANYYHLPISGTWPPQPGTASTIIPKLNDVHFPGPDVIISTKPDIFDPTNARLPWISRSGSLKITTLIGFDVYQISPTSSVPTAK